MNQHGEKSIISFESETDSFEDASTGLRKMLEMAENDKNIAKYSESIHIHFILCESMYKKNLMLIQKVEKFKKVILSNAGKISTLVKTLKTDNNTIKVMKEQYNDGLNVINNVQIAIAKSKKEQKNLRIKIEELNQMVNRGEFFNFGGENPLEETENDIKNLKIEKERTISEDESLRGQIQSANVKVSKLNDDISSIRKHFSLISSSLESYNKIMVELKDIIERTSEEIIALKPVTLHHKIVIEDNSEKMAEKINNNRELVEKRHYLLCDLCGLKESYHMVNSINIQKAEKLDGLKRGGKNIDGAMQNLIKQIDNYINIIEQKKKTLASCEQQVISNRLELDKITSLLNEKLECKNNQRKKIKHLHMNMLDITCNITKRQNEIHHKNRQIVRQILQGQMQKNEEYNQKKDIFEAIENNKSINSNMENLKMDLQKAKEKILSLLEEIDHLWSNTVQTERKTVIQVGITNETIEHAEIYQKELDDYDQKKINQELITEQLRKERSSIKKNLILKSNENNNYIEQINQMDEYIKKYRVQDSEINIKITEEHANNRISKVESYGLDKSCDRYRGNILSLERIITILKAQRHTYDYFANELVKDHMLIKKERYTMENNIKIIKNNILKAEANFTKLRSDVVAMELKINKSAHAYDDYTEYLSKQLGELRILYKRTMKLMDKKAKINQNKYKINKVQSSILYEEQKNTFLLNDFAVPRNVHRWKFISAVDPQHAANLRYRATLSSKIMEAHEKMNEIIKKKSKIQEKLACMNSKLDLALSHQEVRERIDHYASDIREKEAMIEQIAYTIGTRSIEMNILLGNVQTMRNKILKRREAKAVIRSKSSLPSLKKYRDNQSNIFVTEAYTSKNIMGSDFVKKVVPSNKRLKLSDLAISSTKLPGY